MAVAAALTQILAFDHLVAGLMLAAVAPAVVFLFSIWNIMSYSPGAMRRLQEFAEQADGRFTLWKPGRSNFDAVPFKYDVEQERFGVVNVAPHGVPVEIGHLSSQVSARHRAPGGRRRAYVVLKLPQRLPHMIFSIGHQAKLLGIRVVPEQWDRSQRVDIGQGRRFKLFVADGGESVARTFLTPDIVQLFDKVGRHYDIEINGHHLYLIANRSTAAGSKRRWQNQRALLDELARTMASSTIWDYLRQHSRRLNVRETEMRTDIKRALTIFLSGLAAFILVICLMALTASGHIEWFDF
ncbi:MAG: hypothetical protein ACTIK9_02030 [Agrococcus casei]|uniref:hypothetical protein n=2 Tax=Agrococcus casei TaxID=343512 RepID=UPI003F90F341